MNRDLVSAAALVWLVAGCSTIERLKEEPEEKKTEKPRDADCKVKIANAAFTVRQTGQKKGINGFDTEQYQAAWIVTLQDPTARKTVSTLNVDVWTTPVTPQLKEALAVEQAYARNLANNLVSVATGGRARAKPGCASPPATRRTPGPAARFSQAFE